ncbi:MAG: membrane dipeptidase, partial [SAR202 cluster bacterium]|nr:membrane dipeptidase [SAR202 cluster bacterium]
DTRAVPRRAIYPREAITLDDLVDHMDHVNQLAGDSRHSSIGGDTDGQGGTDGAPADVDTVSDYQIVGEILADRGYGQDDIDNMLYGNWQRFFEKWLPTKI